MTAICQTISDSQTEERAGTRERMRIDGNGKFPRHWNIYLQNVSDKVELFHLLSVSISQTVFCEGNIVIMSTLDEHVLGSPVLCHVR